MNARAIKSITRNPNITKLLQLAVSLPEEHQLALLRHAQDLAVKDKRDTLRKACDIMVSYANDCRVYTNNISNISKSGLFIETQQPLAKGDEIIMTFRLEGFDKPFKIKGEIARSTAEGFGVKFKDISPYIAEMIEILIKRMQ